MLCLKKFLYFLMVLYPLVLFSAEPNQSIDFILNYERFYRSKVHAENILTHFPSDRFVILSLGRTTGLVSEWLRQLSGQEDYVIESPVKNLRGILELTPEEKAVFFQKILPSREVLTGRHLVLFRVLWRSLTLNSIGDYLVDYLKTKNYPIPLYSYLIVGYGAQSLPILHSQGSKKFHQNILVKLIEDPQYQMEYADELDDPGKPKGLIQLGMYESADPMEIIHNEFKFRKNSTHDELKNMIQKELKKIKTTNKRCMNLFESLSSSSEISKTLFFQ